MNNIVHVMSHFCRVRTKPKFRLKVHYSHYKFRSQRTESFSPCYFYEDDSVGTKVLAKRNSCQILNNKVVENPRHKDVRLQFFQK